MTTRYFVPRCFDVHWNAPLLNWRNCWLDVKMLLENCFTLLTVRATCVFYCLWHSENSPAVALLLHADWMILKNVSNQRGANSVTIAPWQTDTGRFKSVISRTFFVNYLPVSTWILNGSSIECQEKKHQPSLKYAILSGKSFVTRTWKLYNFKFFGKLEK